MGCDALVHQTVFLAGQGNLVGKAQTDALMQLETGPEGDADEVF